MIILESIPRHLRSFCHFRDSQYTKMRIKNSDKLDVVNHRLRVNGRIFEVHYPDEPLCCVDRGKLVTLVIQGCGCTLNNWEPEGIVGEFI